MPPVCHAVYQGMVSDAWLEDCLRTDKGRPHGIGPAAIRYEDDAIGWHADNWHHPGLFHDYCDFDDGSGTRILGQFLLTYELSGDKRYLEPIELALKIVKKYSYKTRFVITLAVKPG